MTDEQKEFVRKTKAIFDEARFDKMVMSIVNRLYIRRYTMPEAGYITKIVLGLSTPARGRIK